MVAHSKYTIYSKRYSSTIDTHKTIAENISQNSLHKVKKTSSFFLWFVSFFKKSIKILLSTDLVLVTRYSVCLCLCGRRAFWIEWKEIKMYWYRSLVFAFVTKSTQNTSAMSRNDWKRETWLDSQFNKFQYRMNATDSEWNWIWNKQINYNNILMIWDFDETNIYYCCLFRLWNNKRIHTGERMNEKNCKRKKRERKTDWSTVAIEWAVCMHR